MREQDTSSVKSQATYTYFDVLSNTGFLNRNAKSKVCSDLISGEIAGVDMSVKTCASEYHAEGQLLSE